jgi:hypothetical protein
LITLGEKVSPWNQHGERRKEKEHGGMEERRSILGRGGQQKRGG